MPQIMPSSKAIHLLLLHAVIQLLGICVQPDGVSAEQHRITKHTSPSPEPTLEPTSFSAAVHVDSVPVSLDAEEGASVVSYNEITENALDFNTEAWKSASPPITDSTRFPGTTTTSDVTTDALIGTLVTTRRRKY